MVSWELGYVTARWTVLSRHLTLLSGEGLSWWGAGTNSGSRGLIKKKREQQGLGLGTTAVQGRTWLRHGLKGVSLLSNFVTLFCKWIQLAWKQILLDSRSFFLKLAARELYLRFLGKGSHSVKA